MPWQGPTAPGVVTRTSLRILNPDAEPRLHLAPSDCGQGQCAAVQILHEPFLLQCDLEKRVSQCTADVRTSLAPINAGIGEAPPQGPNTDDIDTKPLQRVAAVLSQF